MRMSLVLVALVAVAAGCSTATPEEQLQGEWVTAPDSQGCISAVSFKDSQVELDTICELTTGAIGLDAAVGTFAIAGSDVQIVIGQATCPTAKADASLSLAYSFTHDDLRLIGPNGGLVLSRAPDGNASGAQIKFGCWDDAEKNFTPGSLAPPM